MRHHFGPPPSARLVFSTAARLSLYEGEGGGGGGGGGGTGEKTFTQAELDAHVKGLKDKNSEILGSMQKFKARADAFGDLDPEQVKADLEFAAKAREAEQRKAGEFDAMKADMVKKHGTEIEKYQAQVTGLTGHIRKLVATNVATAEIQGLKGSVKVLLPHIERQIKVVEENGEYVARVIDANGNIRVGDGKGTPMTIKQLVEEFKADTDFGGAFTKDGTSGSGAPGAGGGNSSQAAGNAGEITISWEDAQDVQKYRAAREQAEKEKRPFRILPNPIHAAMGSR